MKTKLVILFSVAATIIVFGTIIIPYDKARKPSLTLPAAYEKATTALGSATNQFHCEEARVLTDFGPEGEWRFTFYSTNARPKWVTVEFNGKIHIEDILNR